MLKIFLSLKRCSSSIKADQTINKIKIAMASDTRPVIDKNGRVREKVQLKPGFHLMDWMRLVNSAKDISGRNGGPLLKISLKELKEHKSKYDCWTAYKGKVYNITQYLEYHPGGEKILMSVAGKDCTKLYDKYHKWVNIESIIGKCVVGILMSDENIINEDDEEEDENNEQIKDMKITASDSKDTDKADNDLKDDRLIQKVKDALSLDDEDKEK